MDLDTILRETAACPEPSREVLAAGRAALDAATAGTVHRTPRRRLRIGLTTAVAAAASVALVLGPTIDLGNGPAAKAEAQQVMLRAGAAAGAQPGGWPDAAYWHSVSTYRQGSGPEHRREIWIGHREIGVLKDGGVATGVLPLDVAYFPAGDRGVTWDELYALPTDPDALEADLRGRTSADDGKARDPDARLFVNVGDLLRESPASPALRKALWEVAARIPGVTLVGTVTDDAGRQGVAVEHAGQRYVIDTDDGRLLAESHGEWSTTYLEQGPSETAPAPTNVGPKG